MITKFIRYVINLIINNTQGSFFSAQSGVKDIIEQLPFALPTQEQIASAANIVTNRYVKDSDLIGFDRIGLVIQKTEEDFRHTGITELEAGIKVALRFEDSKYNISIIVYGDINGTWQFVTGAHKIDFEADVYIGDKLKAVS